MFDMELSRLMANAGGIGLEKTFMKQMLKEYQVDPDKASDAPHGPEKTARREARQDAGEERRPNADNGSIIGRLSRFPLLGRISSYFGDRKDPLTGDDKFHHGLDIAAAEGSPVYPAAPGRVIFSGKKDGYGNVVEVLHENGVITKYGHNERNLVKEGDTVDPAKPIAYVGSTGRSTGPHLHFEVIMDGRAIDPGQLLYG
ncbi:MAG: peptidoglycan DD-metalloendopeptidase family protein [Deltaproteobacteria bacterium]|nr:peptidoglycan DD-metalloendopeptidase family protein [Deltaproteobacteria bacterium]